MNTSGRFLKRICERVKKLDILAPEVGLSVQGDSGVKSYIGVMLSFACIGLFVGAATYGTITSLRTDQPSVVQQTSNSNVYPTMDLIKDKKFPAVMLYSQSTGPIVVEQISRYVTIAAAKQSRQFVDNDPNKEPIFKTDIIPMIPCRQLSQEDRVKLGGPTSPIEVAVFNNNALCPDLSKINFDVTVSGKTSDTRAEDMFVLLYPCVPALAPGGCATLPEVASTGVLLLPNLMNIDLSNYKEPITQAYNTDQDFSINPSFVQQVTTRLKMVEVWNSNGCSLRTRWLSANLTSTLRDHSFSCETLPRQAVLNW